MPQSITICLDFHTPSSPYILIYFYYLLYKNFSAPYSAMQEEEKCPRLSSMDKLSFACVVLICSTLLWISKRLPRQWLSFMSRSLFIPRWNEKERTRTLNILLMCTKRQICSFNQESRYMLSYCSLYMFLLRRRILKVRSPFHFPSWNCSINDCCPDADVLLLNDPESGSIWIAAYSDHYSWAISRRMSHTVCNLWPEASSRSRPIWARISAPLSN